MLYLQCNSSHSFSCVSPLLGLHAGGGVCGAIFAAAGRAPLQADCDSIHFTPSPSSSSSTSGSGSDPLTFSRSQSLSRSHSGSSSGGSSSNRCPTGHSVATRAFGLPCRAVIHTVGPAVASSALLSSHHQQQPTVTARDAAALASCYRTALDLCKRYGLRTVAFPCVSTGIYGFPNDRASRVALKTVREWMQEEACGDNADADADAAADGTGGDAAGVDMDADSQNVEDKRRDVDGKHCGDYQSSGCPSQHKRAAADRDARASDNESDSDVRENRERGNNLSPNRDAAAPTVASAAEDDKAKPRQLNKDFVDRVVFCTFLEVDEAAYLKWAAYYFPHKERPIPSAAAAAK